MPDPMPTARMTRAQLKRYFALEHEREERGRLDPTDAVATPRWYEYQQLGALFEQSFKDYGQGLIQDESEELQSAYERWTQCSEDYQKSLEANTRNWGKLCRYWYDRANALQAQLKALQGEESPDA